MPTRCNRWFFIARLIVCSTRFGHHYAHHQGLKSIIQVVAALWYLVLWFSGCRSGVELWVMCLANLYNTLELLIMGITVPETCWANSKSCNKEPSVASSWHSFPNINNDAQSNSDQVYRKEIHVEVKQCKIHNRKITQSKMSSIIVPGRHRKCRRCRYMTRQCRCLDPSLLRGKQDH